MPISLIPDDEHPYKITVVTLDLELARELLGRNLKNRNRKSRSIQRYRLKMANGTFGLSVISIAGYIGKRGWQLIDGQNRLYAFVEAAEAVPDLAPVRAVIIEGMKLQDQDHYDSGVPRSAGDQLRKYPNASALGAMVRLLIQWEGNAFKPGSGFVPVDNEDIVTFVGATGVEALTESIHVGSRCYHRMDNRGRPTVFAAAHRRFAEIDGDDADQFFELLGTDANRDDMTGVVIPTPISALRRTILLAYGSGQRASTPWAASRMLAIVIQAWNDWRDGEHRKSPYDYRPTKAKEFPEPR